MSDDDRSTSGEPYDPTAVTFVGFVLSLAHTAEERQLVEQLLYELRMRFVEASKTATPEPSRIIIP
jgi:hypothetical protein